MLLVIAIAIYFVFGSDRTCEDAASAVVDAELGCTSREVVAKYADDCEDYDIMPDAAKDVTIKVRVSGNDTGNDYR